MGGIFFPCPQQFFMGKAYPAPVFCGTDYGTDGLPGQEPIPGMGNTAHRNGVNGDQGRQAASNIYKTPKTI